MLAEGFGAEQGAGQLVAIRFYGHPGAVEVHEGEAGGDLHDVEDGSVVESDLRRGVVVLRHKAGSQGESSDERHDGRLRSGKRDGACTASRGGRWAWRRASAQMERTNGKGSLDVNAQKLRV